MCSKHYQMWRVYGRTDKVYAEKGSGHTNLVTGYREVYVNGIKKNEHVVVAEKALGKPMPKGAVVHHVTENKADNLGDWKLVICPNQAYHALIHTRMRELGVEFYSDEEGIVRSRDALDYSTLNVVSK